jgi:hypothetical protein
MKVIENLKRTFRYRDLAKNHGLSLCFVRPVFLPEYIERDRL